MLFASHLRPGLLKKLALKTAWGDSAGPGGIFVQNLPSWGVGCTCAVSPHKLGVLTCSGEYRVAVAMAVLAAALGLVPTSPVNTGYKRAPCRN